MLTVHGENNVDNASQKDLKKAVLHALEENDLDTAVALACRNKAVLSILVRLAYDKETLVGWRAIIAAGRIASVFIRTNYEHIRVTIRKLLWMLSDESGGIGWAAPEMLGEIVRADPVILADIIPLIAETFFIEERNFRPGVLYALKRIAEVRPESVQPYEQIAFSGLRELDPLSRMYALELLTLLTLAKVVAGEKALEDIRRLFEDKAEVWVYVDSAFVSMQIDEMARKCMETINRDILMS